MNTQLRITLLLLPLVALSMVLMSCGGSQSLEGKNYSLEGIFIEGCACEVFTPCDMVEETGGCERLGVMSLNGGRYMNVDLNQAKVAYAIHPGDWVRLYVDAVNNVQREAAIAFARNYFGTLGKVEEVKEARVVVEGDRGNYNVRVNDGNIMQLTTQPIVGGDDENPITIVNARNKLNPTYMQGKTVVGTYADGGRQIEIRDKNAIFNNELNTDGDF